MMIYIINNQPHSQGVFMIKNYKLILIGMLVSCSLSDAMEKATISVAQAEMKRRDAEALKRQAEAKKMAEKREMGARPTMAIVQAEIERRNTEANKQTEIRYAKIKVNADGETSLHIAYTIWYLL